MKLFSLVGLNDTNNWYHIYDEYDKLDIMPPKRVLRCKKPHPTLSP